MAHVTYVRALIGPILLAGVLSRCLIAAQSDVQWPVDRFLQKYAHATGDELGALQRGQPFVRTLKTGDDRDLAIAGAVALDLPKEFFLERYRDIAAIKKAPAVVQIGRFGDRPSQQDIEPLRLDPHDIDALRRCHPGDCAMRLTKPMIERFERDVDWAARDHVEQASQVMRDLLAERATSFLRQGAPAITPYADQGRPIDPANAFSALVRDSAYLAEYAPEVARYLESYPDGAPCTPDGFVYWSKEEWGPMRVISLTDVTITPRPCESPREIVIATRDIYANHVLDASLALLVVSDRPEPTGRTGSYLLYINRSRVDALRGFLSSVRRSIVQRRQQDSTRAYLRDAKVRLESAYRVNAGSK
jgi:hypothetical protein